MIHVAVGIVFNEQNDVLIAKRPLNKQGGGLWEFPGGKVKPTETVFAALQREFQEEIDIQILHADPWLQVEYSYHDRNILLDTWLVQQFIGEPCGAEGQAIRWVAPYLLQNFQFPEGNREIIRCLMMGLNRLKLSR